MRILVVEDYPGAAEMTCTVLRLMGHDAFAARTGRDALARAVEIGPEIIILDLGLPDISGYEVARALRSRPGRRVFIAAMSGSDAVETRVRSLAAGIDMHLVKPTTGGKLAEVVRAAEQLAHVDRA